jgi:sucrose-6-phosphate hydrolase SacC (GH32 family)
MRRLLLVLVVLGVAGTFPRLLAPSGSAWTRSASNPLMTATLSWESTAMQEPMVLLENGLWKMWYTGGWSSVATGYATSTDGITWTKYAGNPVYGQGGSGYAGGSNCPQVTKVGSTYYLYSTDNAVPKVNIATSTDGITWTTQTPSISLPSGKTLWGNRVVWIEGATWKMLQEAGNSPWEIYYYTSSDGLTWSIQNSGNPLTTLQVHAAGMYGGPTMAQQGGITIPKRGGLYEIWYHAAPGAGNTPTNIYRATSPDLITWTQAGAALTHTGSGDEADQIADPAVIVVGSVAYLYYDAVVNATSTGKIMLATGVAAP